MGISHHFNESWEPNNITNVHRKQNTNRKLFNCIKIQLHFHLICVFSCVEWYMMRTLSIAPKQSIQPIHIIWYALSVQCAVCIYKCIKQTVQSHVTITPEIKFHQSIDFSEHKCIFHYLSIMNALIFSPLITFIAALELNEARKLWRIQKHIQSKRCGHFSFS